MGLLDGLMGHASDADTKKIGEKLEGILLPEEEVRLAFNVLRDFFVFTDLRFMIVDVQGMTGKKTNYLTIPYGSISRFSLETAGSFDLEAELRIWLSGEDQPIERTLGKGVDTKGIQQALAAGTLR
ncbi:PH domain-containing protein [Pararhizobium mangrovi]|uniref:PH domain-containing protein n=1 Tax=Pararhizobium mangrovi TaxID=2590452 RepID=A0A506UA51_9HYPH|nr:PH domain-containing protein [Pararhizobium mangrovi]TPW31312.1 PH domain-containing protein [Pararhizobium mangrovi]